MIAKFLYSFFVILVGTLGAGIFGIVSKAAMDAIERDSKKNILGLTLFSIGCMIVAAFILIWMINKLGGIW